MRSRLTAAVEQSLATLVEDITPLASTSGSGGRNGRGDGDRAGLKPACSIP